MLFIGEQHCLHEFSLEDLPAMNICLHAKFSSLVVLWF